MKGTHKGPRYKGNQSSGCVWKGKVGKKTVPTKRSSGSKKKGY